MAFAQFAGNTRDYTVLARISIRTPQGTVYNTPANVVLRVPQANPATAVIRDLKGIWGSVGKIRLTRTGSRSYAWTGPVLSGRYAGGRADVTVSI